MSKIMLCFGLSLLLVPAALRLLLLSFTDLPPLLTIAKQRMVVITLAILNCSLRKMMKRKLLPLLLSCAMLMCTAATCRNQSTLDTTYKVEGGLITTVDSGMQAWASYVKSGQATQGQVDAVKAAYLKYYNAQQIAKVGLHVALANTNNAPVNMADVNAAEAALIQLITSFITTKH